PRQLREAIDAFTRAYNKTSSPFEWTKREVGPKGLSNRYGHGCK
ncbi:IS630 family transposase, partial [Candidatus Poribacteria bacterium]|nr:IS630 family transposase [Candidatus Poribacteria bacterium]MBI5154422.1 IS630 family transposase [Candidatus Poribacteria bacterium]